MKLTPDNTIKSGAHVGGFTLVEIIVSLAIFSVVAVVAAGALLKILDANRKAQSIQAAMTNLNFALETMSRELRVGSRFQCSYPDHLQQADAYFDGYTMSTVIDCDMSNVDSPGGVVIGFKSSEAALDPDTGATCDPAWNLAYAYMITKDPIGSFYSLKKAKQAVVSSCQHGPLADTDFNDVISSDNVHLTGFHVAVVNGDYANGVPYPLAQIRLTGYAGTSDRDTSYFDIQTAVSARSQ